MPLTAPYDPVEISDVSLAFPADALDYMPPEDVGRNTHRNGWAYDLVRDWFFGGLENIQFAPWPHKGWKQEDVNRAARHLKAIMGSFAPKHEHKEDALVFLIETWFEAVRWKPKGADEWKSTPDVEWPDE